MIIAESAVRLSASHTSIEQHEQRESLVVQQGKESRGKKIHGKNSAPNQLQALITGLQEQTDQVSLSSEATRKGRPVKAMAEPVPEEQEAMTSLNMRILKALFEKITGHKFSMRSVREVEQQVEAAMQQPESEEARPVDGDDAAPVSEGDTPQDGGGQLGWGIAYDYYESHYEYESTEFSAQGTIQTADGQQIDFSVSLNMSREFFSEQQISLRAGDMLKDPLTVNFDGTAAELTQTKFSFDIDADGREDQISFVGPGSGFLALDLNGDQVINDGRELFGAMSGDGFAELARFDDDGNGWIDENDSVYDRLRIWSKTAAGEDQLVALGSRGIGALYLGNVSTPFSVKDTDNVLQGQVLSSGMYLYEDGRVGTMQQVNLVA